MKGNNLTPTIFWLPYVFSLIFETMSAILKSSAHFRGTDQEVKQRSASMPSISKSSLTKKSPRTIVYRCASMLRLPDSITEMFHHIELAQKKDIEKRQKKGYMSWLLSWCGCIFTMVIPRGHPCLVDSRCQYSSNPHIIAHLW